jgi:Ser/Thr protein kinase RdoA (MazF antagonist)
MESQLAVVIEGYRQFCDFDARELQLIEALRTLRMLHHAAWLARRWEDPAFPIAFPWFDGPRYWEDLVLSLREQLSRMQEPALELRI